MIYCNLHVTSKLDPKTLVDNMRAIKQDAGAVWDIFKGGMVMVTNKKLALVNNKDNAFNTPKIKTRGAEIFHLPKQQSNDDDESKMTLSEGSLSTVRANPKK